MTTFPPDDAFCAAEDKDIMTVGEMIRLYPALEQVVDYALPEGTAMEDDGTGGGGVDDAEEPSAKRAKAKATGQEARAEVRKSQRKGPKKTVDIQKATADAMTGAMTQVMPTLQSFVPKPSPARLNQEESERTSAKLAMSTDLCLAYEELTKSLAVQRAKPDVDKWYVGVLEKRLAAVRVRMEKDADEQL